MDIESNQQKITKVVHCRKEHFDVMIDRRTPYGNPFIIGRDGDRETVIKKYLKWVLTKTDLIAKMHKELKGKTLGCWCKPAACHGDVIVDIVERSGKAT